MALSLDEKEALIRRTMADILLPTLKGQRLPTEDELKRAASIAKAIVEYEYREPVDPRDGIAFV